MNDIALSNDLYIITAEIKSYRQIAGQAIFEIGRRLKHVKENDLTHGQWLSWLKSVDIHERQAQRIIKITEELGSDATTWSDLSLRKLYEIATLPSNERVKEHLLPNGETKTVDEMTIREIEELKKSLKEEQNKRELTERQLEQARKSEEIALRKLEEVEQKQVIEKEIIKEVIPDHIKQENRELKKKLKELQSEEYHLEEERRRKEYLQLQADNDVLSLANNIDDFIRENSITSYRAGALATADDLTKKTLREGLDALKNFITDVEWALSGIKG